MKRSKRIITLVAVLAVVCIATLAVVKHEEKQEEIKSSNAVILELPADTVEELSWEYDGSKLAFRKEEEGWLYEEDEAFPTDKEKLMDILSHFEAFGVSFIIENADDYSQYGLEAPECTIHLKTSEESYEIKLGDFSKMDKQRYADIGDGNVYLVSDDPVNYLTTELSDLILQDTVPELENIVNIQFAGAENYTVTYMEGSEASYSEEDVYFVEKDGESLPLDTETVNTYLSTVASLYLSDYVTYKADTEELESCGLDEPELSVTVNYTYTDEEEKESSDTFVFHIGRNKEELLAYQKAEKAGKEELPAVTSYVRIGDSPIIYELDSSSYETLAAASYDDFRHDEVIWADFDAVTKIEVSLEDKAYAFTSSKKKKDEERSWYYEDEEIDIYDFKTALNTLKADSFTEEAADGKEEISLTVYLENESFPETEIGLYRYDGSYCLAVVDGESVSLVERSSVTELVEAVWAIVLN